MFPSCVTRGNKNINMFFLIFKFLPTKNMFFFHYLLIGQETRYSTMDYSPTLTLELVSPHFSLLLVNGFIAWYLLVLFWSVSTNAQKSLQGMLVTFQASLVQKYRMYIMYRIKNFLSNDNIENRKKKLNVDHIGKK